MNYPWAPASLGTDLDKTYAECCFDSSKYKQRYYPFKFKIYVEYVLSKKMLCINYKITSQSNNMFFSIGNHLTLNYPFTSEGQYNSGILKSSATKNYKLTSQGLLSGETEKIDMTTGVKLSDTKFHNTVIGGFKKTNSSVTLIDPKSFGIKVTQREFEGTAKCHIQEDQMYYVFYGIPSQNYFCVEPWYGAPNSFNTKKGIIVLNKGETFIWQIELKILF